MRQMTPSRSSGRFWRSGIYIGQSISHSGNMTIKEKRVKQNKTKQIKQNKTK